MLEDVDDDDEEEIRNDKATRVSSMLIQFSLFDIFLNFQMVDKIVHIFGSLHLGLFVRLFSISDFNC